jgi:hypothetical protein
MFADLLLADLGKPSPADLETWPQSRGYDPEDAERVIAVSQANWKNDPWYAGFKEEVAVENVGKENVPRHETAAGRYMYSRVDSPVVKAGRLGQLLYLAVLSTSSQVRGR